VFPKFLKPQAFMTELISRSLVLKANVCEIIKVCGIDC